jgi:hypothetical protein
MAAAQPGAVTLLLIQAGTSCFMVGLIWTMQILNYPLLARIDPADVPRYEQAHNRPARHGAPSHARLAQQFDPAVHALLVRTNWIRTAAWTALGILDLIALAYTLPA